MSSLSIPKDDRIVVEGSTSEVSIIEKTPTTEVGNSETKAQENQELTHVTQEVQEPVVINAPEDAKVPKASSIEKERIENASVTSTIPVVESNILPGGSGNVQSPAQTSMGRVLLKRRSSRISTPTIGRSTNVADEVDSAPRSSKRRNPKKKIIALFLESDYPRKKY